MILSDRSIREVLADGRIQIDPYTEGTIQPSSIDVHLGEGFMQFDVGEILSRNHMGWIDPMESSGLMKDYKGDPTNPMAAPLGSGQFALGTTLECVKLADDIVARIEGKSSLGRLGLLVHATAGFVDAGWDGQLTLELFNLAPRPIVLRPGMKIAQISFMQMTTPAEYPYGSPELGSKYQGQTGTTASRYEENYR